MNILFLCIDNSCRSQMAEVIAKDLYPQHHFYSAGIEVHGINEFAKQVCKEINLDYSKQFSKHLDSLADIKFDLVMTVCDNAKETCPVFFGCKNMIHHSFQDPPKLAEGLAGKQRLNIYRKVRDQIKLYLQTCFAKHL